MVELPDEKCYKNDNQEREPCRLVEVGEDGNLKFRYLFFLVFGRVVGRIFHLQCIVVRRQVGIGGKTPVVGHVYPAVVEAE